MFTLYFLFWKMLHAFQVLAKDPTFKQLVVLETF